jgi:hypothetical protein
MKKGLVFFALLVIGCVFALWSPWLYLKVDFLQFFGIEKPEEISGLQVYSLAGELDVYLDGELKGTSSADRSPLILDNVLPGDYLLTIKRKTQIRGSYWEFNKLVSFIPGTSVVISFNLGPEKEFSEGHIIYATEKVDQNAESKLNILLEVDNPKVLINNIEVPRINEYLYSMNVQIDNIKTITIEKDGYDTLSFTIFPESEEERAL